MSAVPHQSILAEAIKKNWSVEEVAQKLVVDGHDEVSVDLLLREYKKMRNNARQSKGFMLMAAGAILGFLSFLFTVLNVFPGHTNLVLYGLTTLAISVAFWGLYYVFE